MLRTFHKTSHRRICNTIGPDYHVVRRIAAMIYGIVIPVVFQREEDQFIIKECISESYISYLVDCLNIIYSHIIQNKTGHFGYSAEILCSLCQYRKYYVIDFSAYVILSLTLDKQLTLLTSVRILVSHDALYIHHLDELFDELLCESIGSSYGWISENNIIHQMRK